MTNVENVEAESAEAEAETAVVGDPARAAAVAEYLVKALADEPEAVTVAAQQDGSSVRLDVAVAPGDLGRVIGEGDLAALDDLVLRLVVLARVPDRAAAHLDGLKVDVEFD